MRPKNVGLKNRSQEEFHHRTILHARMQRAPLHLTTAFRRLSFSCPLFRTRAAQLCVAHPFPAGRRFAASATPRQSHADRPSCWQCPNALQRPPNPFFCAACGVIQPPPSDTMSFFDMFQLGLPRFDLDLALLERRYKDAQKQIHPDLFSNKSPHEQALSARASAHVVHAFKTLQDPTLRACYLLKLHGIIVAEEGSTITDPEFLMEMMEFNEQAEGATSGPARQALLAALNDAIRTVELALPAAFSEAAGSPAACPSSVGGCATSSAVAFAEARRLTLRLLYLDRLRWTVHQQADIQRSP